MGLKGSQEFNSPVLRHLPLPGVTTHMEDGTPQSGYNHSIQVLINRGLTTRDCLGTIGDRLRSAMRDIIRAGSRVHPEVSLPVLQALQDALDAHAQASSQTEFSLDELKYVAQAPVAPGGAPLKRRGHPDEGHQ